MKELLRECRVHNILLMTSPAPGSREYGFYLGEKRFPLGIGYIISALRQKGYSPDFVDLYAGQALPFLNKYDFIGIYVNTICFKNGTLPLLQKIKNFGYRGKIIVGGPHASVAPNTFPDYVDHVVVGEGERAMCDILDGVINERIIHADRISDLDALPRPAYDIFDLQKYMLTFEEDSSCKRVFTYSSSRGCPYSCAFCGSAKIYNHKWTHHSPQRVVDDIVYLEARYGVDGIYFREDNFAVNTKRVHEICDLLIAKNINIKWKCEMRVDIGGDLLEIMKAAGCEIVYVGFESGSQRMLDLMNKGINLDQAFRFVENAKRAGLKIYGSFVMLLPWEEEEDRILTDQFIKQAKLDRVCKNKYLAMPGSRFYDEIIESPALADRYNTVIIRIDNENEE